MADITLGGKNAPSFDYAEFADDGIAEVVKASSARILGYYGDIHDRILRIGAEFAAMKQIIPYALWGKWLKLEFDNSEDTAENYINAALHVPELVQERTISATALYELARKGTPQEVRDEIKSLASQGQKIDYESAYIRARAPLYLKQLYVSEQVPKKQAFLATREILSQCPKEVYQLCESASVCNAVVIGYLKNLHAMRHSFSEDWVEISSTGKLSFRRIERVVSLHEATERDIEDYIEDRRYLRFMERQEAEQEYTVIETLTSGLDAEIVNDNGIEITIRLRTSIKHIPLKQGEKIQLTMTKQTRVKKERGSVH